MRVYLDNAATTPLCPAAAKAMEPYMTKMFYNPSAGYSDSVNIKNKIEECRSRLADLLNADTEEIYFTSGGTESDNWALEIGRLHGNEIISQSTEHKAILNKLSQLEKRGTFVGILPVDRRGRVDTEDVKRNITKGRGLLSIMYGNNEIGTIQPVKELAEIAGRNGIWFHTDAIQAFGHVKIDVKELGVDMLSGSSHKFGGPKGVGFLYVDKKLPINPLIVGGGQERGLRGGTENVPGIVGMVAAAEHACNNLERTEKKCRKNAQIIYDAIMNNIPEVIFNGCPIGENRLPNNLSFCFKGVDAAELLVMLDVCGICASAGSACNTSKNSYVLEKIRVEKEYINGCLRLGIDESLSQTAIDYVVNCLIKIVGEIRTKRKLG